jgi:hypothetical protein
MTKAERKIARSLGANWVRLLGNGYMEACFGSGCECSPPNGGPQAALAARTAPRPAGSLHHPAGTGKRRH